MGLVSGSCMYHSDLGEGLGTGVAAACTAGLASGVTEWEALLLQPAHNRMIPGMQQKRTFIELLNSINGRSVAHSCARANFFVINLGQKRREGRDSAESEFQREGSIWDCRLACL